MNQWQKKALYIESILSCLCPHFVFTQDTGISVRKRVIKILRDICLEQPDFHKITEMCVKMIRRVNDEEGIKVCVYFYANAPYKWQCFVFNIQFIYINIVSPTETGEWDIPETLVHPHTQSWQRCHDPEDPEHHRCGAYHLGLWQKLLAPSFKLETFWCLTLS